MSTDDLVAKTHAAFVVEFAQSQSLQEISQWSGAKDAVRMAWCLGYAKGRLDALTDFEREHFRESQ